MPKAPLSHNGSALVRNFKLTRITCASISANRNLISSRTIPFYRFQHERGRKYVLLENPVNRDKDNEVYILNSTLEPNTISPLKHNNHERDYKDMLQNKEWMLAHVCELRKNSSGYRQLECIYEIV